MLASLHAYEVYPAPASSKEEKPVQKDGCPAMIGRGKLLTITAVLEAGELHPSTVTTSVYSPAVVASVGFCAEEVYPLGPFHE